MPISPVAQLGNIQHPPAVVISIHPQTSSARALARPHRRSTPCRVLACHGEVPFRALHRTHRQNTASVRVTEPRSTKALRCNCVYLYSRGSRDLALTSRTRYRNRSESAGVVGCGFLERPRHACRCCLQARVLAGRRRKLRPWGECTKCTKQSPGGTSLERCHTRPGPHHLPTTVVRRPPDSPTLLFLFLLHLPFEQQLLGRVGNTSFRSKAAVIANSLLSARRVACLSRPRNTPSPSCPSSTPKPSRIRSTPPPPAST